MYSGALRLTYYALRAEFEQKLPSCVLQNEKAWSEVARARMDGRFPDCDGDTAGRECVWARSA
jgi:hypothetical protein